MQYILVCRMHGASMAIPRSFSLREIAENAGIPLPEYIISCYHCNNWLTPQEKILYDHSCLLVVWKDDFPYACCQSCIKICCRTDFLAGFERSVPHSRLAELYGVDWDNLIVRCLTCLRQLNFAEKAEIQRNDEVLFVVKNSIRGKCCLCKIGL